VILYYSKKKETTKNWWIMLQSERQRNWKCTEFWLRLRLCMRKWTKGKCFSFFNIRKTLSFINVIFFSLTGIQFSLTIYLYCYQTWKNKESEFQEFTFLQSNMPITLCEFVHRRWFIWKLVLDLVLHMNLKYINVTLPWTLSPRGLEQ